MKYSDKLRDPRWQRKRLEAMQRDDFTCQACRSKTQTLNVHHFRYNGNPWDAALADLETLCETCHERRTEANRYLMGLPSLRANAIAAFFQAADQRGVALDLLRAIGSWPPLELDEAPAASAPPREASEYPF